MVQNKAKMHLDDLNMFQDNENNKNNWNSRTTWCFLSSQAQSDNVVTEYLNVPADTTQRAFSACSVLSSDEPPLQPPSSLKGSWHEPTERDSLSLRLFVSEEGWSHQSCMTGSCHLPQKDLKWSQCLLTCTPLRLSVSSGQSGHLGIEPRFFKPQKTCYCGALSLAAIPAWHAAAPVPASAVLSANTLALLYREGLHILTIKNRSGSKSSLSRRWLLRSWQSLEVAPGVLRHHTVLKNRPAQGLASALAAPSLKTIRPLTFSR